MAIGFNVQFRINEKTSTKVIRLTDTSSNGGGFTFGKGNFSIVFPDGTAINHTDLITPDISAIGGVYEFIAPTDVRNNVLTGLYTITYVVLDNTGAAQTPLVRTITDFNWIKPALEITDKSDVFIPEVQFFDNSTYSPNGNFSGSATRTLSCAFPTTSEASAQPVATSATGTLTPTYLSKCYEGIYNVNLDVVITYSHSSLSWLSVYYTELKVTQFDIRQAPTQLQLVTKMNAFRADIDAYKEKNDTQFGILSERYDIAIALYSHLIARYQTGTLDGSQFIVEELMSILEPYGGAYTYKSTRLTPFELDVNITFSFNISDGTHTDTVSQQSTLLFNSGSAALDSLITDNAVTYTPVFGSTANTFAAGDDIRFHSAVTISTANGLSLVAQALSLALATNATNGAMSATDKAKLDGIASGATANTGTVTSIALSLPSIFAVAGSPITTNGTITVTATGSASQYVKGNLELGTLNTTAVVEATNLYFTEARSRAALSLTTTGSSGAATYNSTTGVLNIPNYIIGVTSFNTRTGAVVLSSGDITTALTFTPENAANKGFANGYASLNSSGLVPTTQLPALVYSFNTRTGAVTLTSSDVTTALGYSPLPTGGTAGQILAKIDGTNYNVQWLDNYSTQVKNDVKLSATLTVGTPVYESTANGTNIIVAAASYTAEATSSKVLGLLEAGGATNDIVKVVTYGLISGLNTSTATAGDPVWLGNGGLIFGAANKPVAPYHMVYIGLVTRVHAVNGEIFVNIQNGYELDEMHDVLLTSKANKDLIYYDSATSLWKNASLVTVLGYTPENAANKGAVNGYASLDSSGLVPSSQLPSYVDDVLEYTNLASFPATGTTGKIYVDLTTSKIYRWSGSTYIEISPTVGTIWGGITGTLSNQTDLQSALDAKQALLSLTSGYVPKATGTSTLGNSLIYDTGAGISIGNTTGSQTLNLHGTNASLSLNSTSGNYTFNAYYNGAIGGGLLLGTEGSSGGILASASTAYSGVINRQGLYSLHFATNDIIRLSIASNGAATFSSTVTASNGLLLGGSLATGYVPYSDSTGVLSNSIIQFDTNKIGIGTAPTYKLDLYNGGTSLYQRLRAANGSLFFGVDSIGHAILADGAIPMYFYNNGAETMRISTANNLLINTTTDAGYKLDVNGTGRFSGIVTFNSSITSTFVTIAGPTGLAGGYGLALIENGNNRWFIGQNWTGGYATNDLEIYSNTFGTILALKYTTGAAIFNNTVTATQYNLSALNTTPSSASDTGTLGEVRIDASYIYVCIATNTWKRTALSTW